MQILQNASIPVEIIHYMEGGLSESLLARFAETLGLSTIIRENEAIYKELNLANADKKTVLKAMLAHPKLLQRPIAELDGRIILARPPEKIVELFHD